MDAMKDAMKRKMGQMKGPSPLETGDAEQFATGGDAIDLSKIDPKLIQAIIKELGAGKAEEIGEPEHVEEGEVKAGLDEAQKGSDLAPNRDAAVNAIADGGTGHDQGGLHARAAAKAKHHLMNMKGKK